MKLEKKHAVALSEFMIDYLLDDFWAFDDGEIVTMGKVVGFMDHHKLLTPEITKCYKKACDTQKLPKKVARLDLDERDALNLVDMMEEFYVRQHHGAGPQPKPPALKSAERYLNKEFLYAQDSVEGSPGQQAV